MPGMRVGNCTRIALTLPSPTDIQVARCRWATGHRASKICARDPLLIVLLLWLWGWKLILLQVKEAIGSVQSMELLSDLWASNFICAIKFLPFIGNFHKLSRKTLYLCVPCYMKSPQLWGIVGCRGWDHGFSAVEGQCIRALHSTISLHHEYCFLLTHSFLLEASIEGLSCIAVVTFWIVLHVILLKYAWSTCL